jgi:Ca-activated chloride channel homolog
MLRRFFIPFIFILLAHPSWTQQTFTTPQTSMNDQLHENVEVNLVNLTLTATDWKGKFVTNLTQQDLTLTENGVVQQIARFANSAIDQDQVPLTVAFLIDTSTSMNETNKGVSKFDIAKKAASIVLSELREQDKMVLWTFNRDFFQVSELTSDKTKIQDALQSMKVQYGRTALFDGIYAALQKIKNEWGRKIMVVCTDGQDNASTRHLDEVLLENLSDADITVLSLGIVEFVPAYTWQGQQEERKQAKDDLQRLADNTGGFAFFPANVGDAEKVTTKLREIVRSQYSIAYKSTNPLMDGSYRKIEIQCKRSKLKLIYRRGYFAK